MKRRRQQPHKINPKYEGHSSVDHYNDIIDNEATERLAEGVIRGSARPLELIGREPVIFPEDNADEDHEHKRWCSRCSDWIDENEFTSTAYYCKFHQKEYLDERRNIRVHDGKENIARVGKSK